MLLSVKMDPSSLFIHSSRAKQYHGSVTCSGEIATMYGNTYPCYSSSRMPLHVTPKLKRMDRMKQNMIDHNIHQQLSPDAQSYTKTANKPSNRRTYGNLATGIDGKPHAVCSYPPGSGHVLGRCLDVVFIYSCATNLLLVLRSSMTILSRNQLANSLRPVLSCQTRRKVRESILSGVVIRK